MVLTDEQKLQLRHEVHSYLAKLTRDEVSALRARFGLDKQKDRTDDDEDLRALAQALVALTKNKK